MANTKDFIVKNAVEVGGDTKVTVGDAAASTVGPEGVFDTTLYTGTEASSQTITNGIDLSTDGGLVWAKARDGAINNVLMDTEQGVGKFLNSNQTYAQQTNSEGIKSFNTDGFTFGNQTGVGWSNDHVYWTFKQQSSFFDIASYTGNGTAGRTVSHNLGSVPSMIFIKATDLSADDWAVYSGELGNTKHLRLNGNDGAMTSTSIWNSTSPSSTEFTLGSNSEVNRNGNNYIAYLFAHDTSADSYIKCGSFTAGSSTETTVDLGWKPQWLMIKITSTTGDWRILDAERGIGDGTYDYYLRANTADIETGPASIADLTNTGFKVNYGGSDQDYIYIAIRESANTANLDLSTGNYFSHTPTSDLQYTFSNPADVQSFQLEVNYEVSTSGDLLFFAADAGNSSNYDDADGWTTIIDIANQTDPDTNFYLVRQTAATDGTYDISFATNNSNAFPSGGAFMCANGATYQGVSQGSGSVSFSSGLTVGESVLFLVESGDASNTTYTPPAGYTVLFESTGTQTTLTHTVVSYKIADATSDSPAAGNFSSGGSYKALVHVRNAGTAATANDIVAQVQKADAVTSTFTVDGGQVAYTYSQPTITWSSAIQWSGGTAPDAPALGEKDTYTFMTDDTGTSYIGFQSGDAFS